MLTILVLYVSSLSLLFLILPSLILLLYPWCSPQRVTGTYKYSSVREGAVHPLPNLADVQQTDHLAAL